MTQNTPLRFAAAAAAGAAGCGSSIPLGLAVDRAPEATF